MGQIVDIGKRIELVPMDPHFHDITIALYQQGQDENPLFLVYTYSQMGGAQGRLQFAVEAMTHLGNMVVDANGLLRFPCGHAHQLACRRVFLESCKPLPERFGGTPPVAYSGQKVRTNHRGYQSWGRDLPSEG